MKMSKKWLLGAAVLAALSFGFVGCSEEEDEDGSIEGAQLTIDNTTGTATKRVYKSTKLKHYGSLVKLELQNQTATSDDGVIGLIWDLKSSEKAKNGTDSADDVLAEVLDDEGNVVTGDARNFLILGFRNQGGTLKYYISKFYNITTFNSYNFGAGDEATASTDDYQVTTDAQGLATGEPRELMVKDFTSLGTANISDGSIYVWADIYPAQVNGLLRKYGVKGSTVTETEGPLGSYVVDIYLGEDEPTSESTYAERIIINQTQTGYTAKPKQAKIARYGNAYSGKTMAGYIEYEKTYADAEVVEDAE